MPHFLGRQRNANGNNSEYYHVPMRMLKIQNTEGINPREAVGHPELWFLAGGNAKRGSPFGDGLPVSYPPSRRLPSDPAVTLLGIYSKQSKTNVPTETCTRMQLSS